MKTKAIDWDKVKKEYRVKTTDELFGIESPPEYQCGKIDDACKAIDNMHSESILPKFGYEIEDLENKLSRIEWDARGLEDKINEVRDAIDLIRVWGNEWKNLAKRLIEDHDIKIEDIQ